MDEARLCATCSAWSCRHDDAWCSNCGAASARIVLTLEPAVLQVRNVPLRVAVHAENKSVADLDLTDLQLPDWISPVTVPDVLPAGTTTTIYVRARTMEMSQPETASVMVQTPAGSASTVVMAIEEQPALFCHPSEVEIWPSGSGEDRRIPLVVAPVSGSLSVRKISTGPLPGLRVITQMERPALASPSTGIPIQIEGDARSFESRSTASLSVEFDGPHGPAQVELQVKVALRNRPQLRLDGEHQPPQEAFQSVGQSLNFSLSNRDPQGKDGGTRNGLLVIESASLEAPANFDIATSSASPLQLRGGEAASVVFDTDLSRLPANGSKPLLFAFRAVTNVGPFRADVPVFIRPVPQFDGVVAIDFGSSSTCCSLAESGREYERQLLDGNNASSPTIVRYIELTEPAPVVAIGARVLELAGREERVAASCIRHLKQRLGEAQQALPVRPSRATEWTTRTATEAAADYLGEVRRILQASKNFSFDNFILTHPAVCSLRQYRNLYLALGRAFAQEAQQVQFIQEPIAALVPFMAEQAAKEDVTSYTVASFDLGGGTTDIAAVRVRHVEGPRGRRDIHPQIVYSRGVRFGGEDLTDFLVTELEARLRTLLSENEPSCELIGSSVPGASEDDIRLNQYTLRQAAEQFKASLSEQGSANEPAQLIMRILDREKLSARVYPRSFSDLRHAGGNDLANVFHAEVKRRVTEIAELLRAALTRIGEIDIIQMSGMTTYLPAVIQTVGELFPDSRIQRASEPKECVVTGACLSHTMRRSLTRRLILPSSAQRTTSDIGMYEYPSFRVALPMDTEIPPEGLVGELPFSWFGSEPVVLHENLGLTEEELKTGHRPLKLGTWKPQREAREAEDEGWTLRLLLKDFKVSVTAIGPAGEEIPFTPLEGTGESARSA